MPNAISTEPLAQMLRSIMLQKRTGLLRIEQLGEGRTEQGEIYFEGGQPMQAHAGQISGKAALKHISDWKHITCSFEGMSRRYPGNTPSLTTGKARKVEEEPPVRLLPPGTSRTENLARPPQLPPAEQNKREKDPSSLRVEKTTLPLAAHPKEPITLANAKASILPTQVSQPLILHGDTLEKYTPAHPARAPRDTQRWTTHLSPETLPPAMQPKPPVTPRLDPLPEYEILPGRQAIFKAKAMVTTTQAIQRMERRERIIFILLDGRRTIQDIAHLTHHTEAEVEKILIYLTKTGYTEYVRG